VVAVRRVLLSPTWWGRHALMVVLVVAFAFLGRWQWTRAMASTGSLQNLLYALEWWVFAGLVVAGWAHMLRDEVRGVDHRAATAAAAAAREELPAFAVPSRRRPRATEPTTPEEDAELAAYNAYLAWLAENPHR